jgi:TonB family protein
MAPRLRFDVDILREIDQLCRFQIVGTVELRAVFAADGTVKHILITEGLPYGLTEAAVTAARQIKFQPATKEGRNVSVYIQLEYNFNLY